MCNSLHVSAIHIYINLQTQNDFNFNIFIVTHILYYYSILNFDRKLFLILWSDSDTT
jgi:hypothetical protein